MPKYPIIGLSDTRAIAPQLLDGASVNFDERIGYSGGENEPIVELAGLSSLAGELEVRIERFELENEGRIDRDLLEGELGRDLYAALDPTRVPLEALDDPAFWRYVGLTQLWPFVSWREPALQPGADWAKVARYVDGRQASECVPLRMFIRASIAHEAGADDLAAAVERGTDFWRSHLVRVGTGGVPPLAGAFIRAQATERLPADEVRVVARRINRTRTNVLMFNYSSSEADDFVKSVW